MEQLKNDIKSKKFSNLYILYGTELYLKKYYNNILINTILTKDEKLMNFDYFEDKSFEVDKMIGAIETSPFFAPYRVINIKDSNIFYQAKKDDIDILLKTLDEIPKSTIVIFNETQIDKRSRLYKKAIKIARLVEFSLPSEKELVAHIKKAFKKYNKTISENTALYFIRYITQDMSSINNEIYKLIDYVSDLDEITIEHINDVCVKSLDLKVFDMVKAVANKKTQLALNIYNNLIFMKEQPLMILSLLIRQFRLVLQTRLLIAKGINNTEIAKMLSIKEFTIKEYFSQSKNFTSSILTGALKEFLQTESDIKTGKLNAQIAIEMLIIKYSIQSNKQMWRRFLLHDQD